VVQLGTAWGTHWLHDGNTQFSFKNLKKKKEFTPPSLPPFLPPGCMFELSHWLIILETVCHHFWAWANTPLLRAMGTWLVA